MCKPYASNPKNIISRILVMRLASSSVRQQARIRRLHNCYPHSSNTKTGKPVFLFYACRVLNTLKLESSHPTFFPRLISINLHIFFVNIFFLFQKNNFIYSLLFFSLLYVFFPYFHLSASFQRFCFLFIRFNSIQNHFSRSVD